MMNILFSEIFKGRHFLNTQGTRHRLFDSLEYCTSYYTISELIFSKKKLEFLRFTENSNFQLKEYDPFEASRG